MPKPRLLLLLDTLKSGGTERQALLLAGALTRRGWTVRVVCLDADTPLLEEAGALGFGVAALEASGAWDKLRALNGILREFGPAVVQSHSPRPHAFCLLLKAVGRRFRWVVAIREALPVFHFKTLRYILTDLLVFRARLGVAAYLSNSRHALERKGLEGTVIGNMLDPGFKMASDSGRLAARRRLGLAEDAFIVGAACNTTPYKGVDILIDAASRLAAREPRLLLVLAGEERGRYGRELVRKAQGTLGARFRFLGLRTDLPDVLPAFDIFCSASLTESSSNAVAEALASGLPCVVTDAGDSAELVGDTGWVVPPESPRRLAEAIGEAARETKESMAARGARARERVERLRALEGAEERHERFYQTLLTGETPPWMPLKYRGDIDGLRGIAVLVILLFHGKFAFFAGGFVGVDIFFVISGFLITSLVLKDVSSGTFSLAGFFARRIRRIFPALFVVILAASAAGYRLLPPDDFSNFGTSQIYTALFASNIHFWRLSLDYFSEGRLYPLLHTWSLGVEEQFYLVAPIAIAVLWKRAPKKFAGTAATAALLSLFAFIAGTFLARTTAFYLAPFRAWEFLAGALLASGAVPRPVGRRIREFASLVGLAAMLAATLGTSNASLLYVIRVAAAVAGTALVIWSGTSADPLVNRLLGSSPLAKIGLISYSLYLWHWPLLVYLRAFLMRPPTWQDSSLALAASIPLAYLSWRFVELPLRSKGSVSQARPAFRLAGIVTLAVLALGFALRTSNGMPGRFSPEVQRLISETPHPGRLTTPEEARRLDFPRIGGTPRILPTFLVWGDSHAGAVEPAFIRLAGKYTAAGLMAAYSSCPPILAEESFLEAIDPRFTCNRFNGAVIRALAKHHVKDVVLVAYWSRYAADGQEFKVGLKRSIRAIRSAGARPWVLEQPPKSPFHPQNRATHLPSWGELESWFSLPRSQYDAQRAQFNGTLVDVERDTDFLRLDPAPRFCDAERCYTALEGKLLYRDTHHLSDSGALRLLPVLERIFAPG